MKKAGGITQSPRGNDLSLLISEWFENAEMLIGNSSLPVVPTPKRSEAEERKSEQDRLSSGTPPSTTQEKIQRVLKKDVSSPKVTHNLTVFIVSLKLFQQVHKKKKLQQQFLLHKRLQDQLEKH